MKNRKIAAALLSAGAVLVRQNKHLVYQFPSGRHLVISVSPSDRRAEQNILADIRRMVKAVSSSSSHGCAA